MPKMFAALLVAFSLAAVTAICAKVADVEGADRGTGRPGGPAYAVEGEAPRLAWLSPFRRFFVPPCWMFGDFSTNCGRTPKHLA